MTAQVRGSVRAAAWILILAGTVGLGASVVLLLEKIAVLTDPTHVPSCDLGELVSCGAVINTWQASLLGDLPNPVIGAIGFPLVAVTGVMTLADARPARWYWWTFAAGVMTGVALIHWLIVQTLADIGALCPWCMLVWMVTMIILGATAVILSRRSMLPARVAEWAPTAVVVWLGALAIAIGVRFADYWASLL